MGLIQNKLTESDFKRLRGDGKPPGLESCKYRVAR